MKNIIYFLILFTSISFSQSEFLFYFNDEPVGEEDGRPPAPTSLVVVGGTLEADLTWEDGVEEYTIYRGTSADTSEMDSVGTSATESFNDAPLTSGIYFYSVKAVGGETSYFSNVASDTVWQEITTFTASKVDSEMISDSRNRDFEGNGDWVGLTRANNNAHGGSWSGNVDDGNLSLAVTEFALGTGDSVSISFWLKINSPSTGGEYSISEPFVVDITGFTTSYAQYTHSTDEAGFVNDAITMSANSNDADPTDSYFDDFSLIWVNYTGAYQKTVTEPTKIKINQVVQTLTAGTTVYTSAGNYSYSGGVLYIGENPSGKTVLVY